MLSGHERNYGLSMDALVTVCSRDTNAIIACAWMLWSTAWMLWSPYALGTRTELWFGHGCYGQRMLLEQKRNYGLGMDAMVNVCSWNTNAIIVWAWMLWSTYALGTRTELWFGHGCSGQCMLLEHERNYGLCMHGCAGQGMLSEHERTYGFTSPRSISRESPGGKVQDTLAGLAKVGSLTKGIFAHFAQTQKC